MVSLETIAMVALAALAVFIAFTKLSGGQEADDHRIAWLPETAESRGEEALSGR